MKKKYTQNLANKDSNLTSNQQPIWRLISIFLKETGQPYVKYEDLEKKIVFSLSLERILEANFLDYFTKEEANYLLLWPKKRCLSEKII